MLRLIRIAAKRSTTSDTESYVHNDSSPYKYKLIFEYLIDSRAKLRLLALLAITLLAFYSCRVLKTG